MTTPGSGCVSTPAKVWADAAPERNADAARTRVQRKTTPILFMSHPGREGRNAA
jgi:hypothetical protein